MRSAQEGMSIQRRTAPILGMIGTFEIEEGSGVIVLEAGGGDVAGKKMMMMTEPVEGMKKRNGKKE